MTATTITLSNKQILEAINSQLQGELPEQVFESLESGTFKIDSADNLLQLFVYITWFFSANPEFIELDMEELESNLAILWGDS